MTEQEFNAFFSALPEVFSRADVHKYLNGMLKPKYLSNLTQQGKGPQHFLVGGRAFYQRDKFLAWARSYYGIKGNDSAIQGSSSSTQES